MILNNSEMARHIEPHKLYQKTTNSISNEEHNANRLGCLSSKAVKAAGLFALKKVTPEGAALYKSYQHIQELRAGNAAHHTNRKLMYISLLLAAKVSRPLLPCQAKALANALSATFECRRKNLNSHDMRSRNNNITRSLLGFFGGAVGGMFGTFLIPSNPYIGYFLGSQAGQTLMQSLPFAQTPRDPNDQLPLVHTKYWGYGWDNDAQNILNPLRAQYQATQAYLDETRKQMYECILMHAAAVNEGRTGEELTYWTNQFAALETRYKDTKNEHTQRVMQILERPQDDKMRVYEYRVALKDYLARNYHDEMVGLIGYAKENGLVADELHEERLSFSR